MIVRSKDILNNKWRIEGTRISVDVVINGLKINGLDWVLKNYPRLTIRDIVDCLSFYIENDREIIGNDINVGSNGGKDER